MSSTQPFNPFTDYHKNVCEYCGGFGALLSLVCLVQHLIFAIPGNITNPMIAEYFLAIVAFLLLALKKTIAPVLIIISGVLSTVVVWLWMTHYAFSLVVSLLFIYHIAIIIIVFEAKLPQKLKEKRRLELEEEKFWENKY
jgi:cbb3-type cytochrome oxidase subunit 3